MDAVGGHDAVNETKENMKIFGKNGRVGCDFDPEEGTTNERNK